MGPPVQPCSHSNLAGIRRIFEGNVTYPYKNCLNPETRGLPATKPKPNCSILSPANSLPSLFVSRSLSLIPRTAEYYKTHAILCSCDAQLGSNLEPLKPKCLKPLEKLPGPGLKVRRQELPEDLPQASQGSGLALNNRIAGLSGIKKTQSDYESVGLQKCVVFWAVRNI